MPDSKQAIIYLHGFNSASLDLPDKLLVAKQKLAVLDEFCQQQAIKICTFNIGYRRFPKLVKQLIDLFNKLYQSQYICT